MKTIGLVIIFAVPCIAGFINGEKKRKVAKRLSSLLSFLRYLSFQIGTFIRPQDEIVFSFEDETLERSGFLPLLRGLEKADPVHALEKALEEKIDDFGLGKSEKGSLFGFARSFGTLSLEMQIKECEKVISAMEFSFDKKMRDLESKIKLSYTVGICIGAGLVIILI